jgi:hypothetical protein
MRPRAHQRETPWPLIRLSANQTSRMGTAMTEHTARQGDEGMMGAVANVPC